MCRSTINIKDIELHLANKHAATKINLIATDKTTHHRNHQLTQQKQQHPQHKYMIISPTLLPLAATRRLLPKNKLSPMQ